MIEEREDALIVRKKGTKPEIVKREDLDPDLIPLQEGEDIVEETHHAPILQKEIGDDLPIGEGLIIEIEDHTLLNQIEIEDIQKEMIKVILKVLILPIALKDTLTEIDDPLKTGLIDRSLNLIDQDHRDLKGLKDLKDL